MNLCYLESCQAPGATKFSHSTTETVLEGGKEKKLIFNHFLCDWHFKDTAKRVISTALMMPKALRMQIINKLRG